MLHLQAGNLHHVGRAFKVKKEKFHGFPQNTQTDKVSNADKSYIQKIVHL
jgi:hypothetical protein